MVAGPEFRPRLPLPPSRKLTLNSPSSKLWPVESIGDFTLPTRQLDPRKRDGTFRYIDISSINRDTKRIEETKELLCAEAPSRARKHVRAGDILVSTVRPNLNAVAQVPDELDGEIASTGFTVLRPNPEQLVPRFLFYRVITDTFIQDLVSQAKGAGYPAVSDRIVNHHHLPLPPLPEQHRIVEILDQADALRQQRREADEIREKVLPGLFYEMFGNVARMGSPFPIVPFDDVLLSTRNGLYKHADFYGSGTPILKMFNIHNGWLRLDRVDLVELESRERTSYRLSKGDILFNRVNTPELVGKCTVIDETAEGAVFESKNIRVQLDQARVSPYYAAAYFNSEFGHRVLTRKMKHAAGMATITGPDIRDAPIPLPPTDLQSQFEHACLSIRNMRRHSTTSSTTLETLFQTLLHRAFDGSLTAKWREGHAAELLQEMEHHAR